MTIECLVSIPRVKTRRRRNRCNVGRLLALSNPPGGGGGEGGDSTSVECCFSMTPMSGRGGGEGDTTLIECLSSMTPCQRPR